MGSIMSKAAKWGASGNRTDNPHKVGLALIGMSDLLKLVGVIV